MKIHHVLIATVLVMSALPAFAQEKPAMKKAELIDLNKLISCDVDTSAAVEPTKLICPDGKTPYEKNKRWDTCPKKDCPAGSTTTQTLVGWTCKPKPVAEPKDADEPYQCADGGPKVVVTKLAKANAGNTYKCTVDGAAIFTNDRQACCPKKVEVAAPAPVLPKAVLTVTCPENSMTCVFDGTNSTPENRILKATIHFGDNTSEPRLKAAHTFKERGTFTAILEIEDVDHQKSQDKQTFPVPGTTGKDEVLPPVTPEPAPAAWWNNLYVGLGLGVLGVGEGPWTLENSRMVIRGPARLALIPELDVGIYDENMLYSLVLRASPLVADWAHDNSTDLNWVTQPGLILGGALAIQKRESNQFAWGGALGVLYQATNYDAATNKSWVSSFAPTVGPRLTWSVLPIGPAKIDLVLDAFVGWDFQYTRPVGSKVTKAWQTPVAGLTISGVIGLRGPDVVETEDAVETENDSLLGTTATERMQR